MLGRVRFFFSRNSGKSLKHFKQRHLICSFKYNFCCDLENGFEEGRYGYNQRCARSFS